MRRLGRPTARRPAALGGDDVIAHRGTAMRLEAVPDDEYALLEVRAAP